MDSTIKVIKPNWPNNPSIISFTTTRHGGISLPPYQQLNIAAHVNDKPQYVHHNRNIIRRLLNTQREPLWLNQTHSTKVLYDSEYQSNTEADAIISTTPGVALVVMTADCLPILLCNKQGSEVAAIHAGWRGLANGIITNTISKMDSTPNNLMAWFGPCIRQTNFEVGQEVYYRFTENNSAAKTAFAKQPQTNKYHACLVTLAKLKLQHLGIEQIYDSKLCSHSSDDFFSYRRDKITGRMGSFIVIK